MSKDDNDLDREGKLPKDPAEDAVPMGQPEGAPREPRPVASLVGPASARFRRRASKAELPVPLPWPTVNEALGGGLWSGLHVLVGNTGSYKTGWALQVALHAAQQGVPTCYVGLELDETQLVARLVGQLSGRHWSKLYDGTDPELEDVLSQHAPTLDGLPLYMESAPPMSWHPADMLEVAAWLREKHPRPTQPTTEAPEVPPLLVVDYLQLVAGQPHEGTRERIQRAAYACTAAANKHDLAMLVLSSTARTFYGSLSGTAKDEKGRDKAPAWAEQGSARKCVGLGKESGELEYAAHSVLVLGREPWPSNEPPRGGTRMHLGLAKLRASAAEGQWLDMRCNGNRFSEPEPARPRRERTMQELGGK